MPPAPPAIVWCADARKVIMNSPVLGGTEKALLLGRLKGYCDNARK
jgi:hypothetical protein